MEITNFVNDKIVSIENFEFETSIGKHDSCEFLALIREKDIGNFQNLLNKTCGLRYNNFSWNGIVTESEIIRYVEGVYVRVHIAGLTILHDKICHNRIFQQPKKTVYDIFGALNLNNASIDGSMKKAEVQNIQIQKNETDFNFLKRLADLLDTNFFALSQDVLKFVVGNFISDTPKNIDKNKAKIWRQVENETGCFIVISTEEDLNVGDQIIFDGKNYILERKRIVKETSNFIQYYYIKELKENNATSPISESILSAKVVENNDPEKLGRIQVEFLPPFEDVLTNERIWIQMSSNYSSDENGLIFIPNIGDEVFVHLKNGIGSYFNAIRDKKIAAPFDTPDKKYLIWGKNQYLEFSDEALKIQNENSVIRIEKDKIEISVDKKNKIKIDKSAIIFSVSDSQVKLEAEKILSAVKNTAVELSDELKIKSGNISVKSSAKTEISARSVQIDGKGGVNIN